MVPRTVLFNIACWIVAVLVGVGMAVVKYRVAEQERRLVAVQEEIREAEREIHMLKAEWSHLNDPQKIKSLAVRYTKLAPIKHDQIVSLSDIAALTKQ